MNKNKKYQCPKCGNKLYGRIKLKTYNGIQELIHDNCNSINGGNMEKTIAVKNNSSSNKKRKYKTITSLVQSMIKQNRTYNQIEAQVKRSFPDSKFSRAHYNVHKKKIRDATTTT